jgi:hypothetical protein
MTETIAYLGADTYAEQVLARVRAGARFAGLYATAAADPLRLRLTVLLGVPAGIEAIDATVSATSYPALTPAAPAAFWYERVVHDLFGTVADGHRRLDPLILPLPDGEARPRPGAAAAAAAVDPDEQIIARHVLGTGLFTIPHGPVRSGVMESVEYLVETPGEDIPHLRVRPYYKHRGVEKRFEGLDLAEAALLAERIEGVAGVAHALA